MKKKTRRKIKTSDPFTLEFIGKQYLDETRMQLFQFNKEKFFEVKNFKENDLDGFPDNESVYWLNIYGIHDVELIKKICDKLQIHRLVVQDILDTNQRPKLQEFENYLFFSVKSILPTDNNELQIEQISFVLGSNYVLSFQERPADFFEHIRQRIRESKGIVRERSADFLLYVLLEAILDTYFTTQENLEPKIFDLISIQEEDPEPRIIVEIENFKKQVLLIKSAIKPLYDAITSIEKGLSEKIQDQHIKYFNDLQDQCTQTLENAETLIQRLESGVNLFFSLQGHRANQVMKTLTMVASIFIPLTFIVGIYGMNFSYMPELSWRYGYYGILAIMLIITIFMLIFFKKKKWF